jgi:signal peptidase I
MDSGNPVIYDNHLRAVLDIWRRRNEHITCSVIGNCMSPVINEKDSIIIEGGVQDISLGDVVVFGSPGSFFVKRVVQIYKNGDKIFFLTKGDKNPTFCEPITKEKILGKVLEVQSSHGHFVFNCRFWKCLNYILGIRSYIHGNRRIRKTLMWTGINALCALRSRILPKYFSAGPFLWKGICRISRILSHK